MKGIAWDLLTGVFVVAVVYMLARPKSPAASAIKSLSDMYVSIVQYATADPAVTK